MTQVRYMEAIRNGFRIINRNWQLVLVQIAAMFLSFFGFLILVGIPLAIAFIVFGLDLTELSRMGEVLRTFHRPAEIISKYFGLVVLVLASILLYVLAVFSLGVFVIGGSIGVIGRAIRDEAERFEMKVFFLEGRKLFFPLLGFTTVVGAIFIAVAFLLGIFGGVGAAIISAARAQEATLALFLGIFFSLIFFFAGLIFILATLAVTIFGIAVLAVKGFGPFRSLKESFLYLYRHSGAFYLYCLAFGGYTVIVLALMLVGYPLKFIPFTGPLIAPLFQFFIHVGQSYLGLVMLATIFWYYYVTEGLLPSGKESSETAALSPISETSTPESGISGIQAPEQGDAPLETEPRE